MTIDYKQYEALPFPTFFTQSKILIGIKDGSLIFVDGNGVKQLPKSISEIVIELLEENGEKFIRLYVGSSFGGGNIIDRFVEDKK